MPGDKSYPTLLDIAGARPSAIEPAEAALIIIDAQVDYSRGLLKLEDLDAALDEIGYVRAWAQNNDVPTIHIQQVGGEGAAVFAPGSDGIGFLAAAEPRPGENIIQKRLPNAFAGTSLQAVLSTYNRKQLVLVGFMTHMCIETTARAALDLGYTTFVVAAATADRPLRAPDGIIVSADDMKRAALTALADRFATILPNASAL